MDFWAVGWFFLTGKTGKIVKVKMQ